MNQNNLEKSTLVSLLVKKGVISLQQAQNAMAFQNESGLPLEKIFLDSQFSPTNRISEIMDIELRFAEGEFWLQKGIITKEDFDIFMQNPEDSSLTASLIRKKILKDSDADKYFQSILEEFCETPAKILDFQITPAVMDILSCRLIFRYEAVPLFKLGYNIIMGMVNPYNIISLDDIKKVTRCRVSTVQIDKNIFEQIVKKECLEIFTNPVSKEKKTPDDYNGEESLEELFDQYNKFYPEAEFDADNVEMLAKKSEISPVIKIVNKILHMAVEKDVSDIHIEPRKDNLSIRFRKDGILNQIMELPKKLQSGILSRLKIMASLDIAEKRLPQDGRIRIETNKKTIDLRVSTMASKYGETCVMRILDHSKNAIDLTELGMPDNILSKFHNVLSSTKGIIFVTGPTGSGKTTTLYAALKEIAKPTLKIITVEDPIEYEIENIIQTQVNNKIGLNFAHFLKAFLRQDPDIIMVGEIRDQETASIAVEAALTGHLVLTSMHSNNSIATLTRLSEMDIEPLCLTSSLLGIVAQRLVRCLCNECKTSYVPPDNILSELKINSDLVFYKANGCQHCDNTGYKGRCGVYEFLEINDNIREHILKKNPDHIIRETASKYGFRSLLDNAVDLLKQGITSIEEIAPFLIGNEDSFTKLCPQCNNIVSIEFPNCPFCQHQLKRFCPRCGIETNKDWKTCPNCKYKFLNDDIFAEFSI